MGNMGHVSSRVVLGTVFLLVVPLLAFPGQFGTDLGRLSILNVLLELGYYGLMVYIFNRRAHNTRIALLAGACLGYRVIVGSLFGAVVAVIYSLGFGTALRLGVYGYVPVLVLQVASAPFALRPLLEQYAVPRPVLKGQRRDTTGKEQAPVMNSIAISREKGIVSELLSTPEVTEPEPTRYTTPAIESITLPAQSEVNGFDRAVKYLGEHGSVYLAAVVDPEGLLLSHFKRGNLIPEDWAPLALVLWEQNRRSLEKLRLGSPEKVDVLFPEKRVVVVHDSLFSILVLSERQSDDTLLIRMNQCMELVRRYMTERYSQPKADINAERIHVSHTK